MNLALRPTTIEAMDRFRDRRSRLLKWRAGLCMLGSLLAALIIVSLLDRAWLLPDIVRPWVSVAVYVGCLILGWRVALRHLGAAKSEMGAASLIESAEPSLRERLLAAVELSQTGDTSRVHDSPEFRARLQDDVAEEVSGKNWKSALPSDSLNRWWLLFFGATAVAVLLSFVPSLHLPGFLARAALPFANLERPSSVKIEIVRPAPASTLAPFASEVEVAVDLIGGNADKVILESAEPSAKSRRIELTHLTGNRYEGRIAVGQTDVRYRFSAADAMTSWHTLSARPRPRVVEFVKTVVPPSYSGWPEQKLTEDHGDIEALEGSVVKLVLKTNQPLSKAEMLLNPEQPQHPQAPESKLTAAQEISTDITVKEGTESWLVSLTAKETGFTNEESSPWRIATVPDLPPTAQITEPVEQLELLPDEAARIAGLATDDVGLASVKLAHAINGTDWKEMDLVSKPGKEASVQHLFQLAATGVKVGDNVILKLVAIDLKGQRAESQPVRVIILEQTVDPRQRQWAEQQRRLAQQTESLAEKTRDMRKVMDKVKKDAKQNNQATDQAESTLAQAQEELRQVKEKADDLWEAVKEAAREAPTALDNQETQLLGERLAHLRQDSIPQMEKQLKEPVESPESLRQAANEANSDADTLASASRVFAAKATAKVAAQAAQQLSRQENLLTDTALPSNRDANLRPKWQEQQRGAIAAAESVNKDVEALENQVDGGQKRNLEQLRAQVSDAARDLTESLDKENQSKSPEHLYGATDTLRQRVNRTAEAAKGIAENASQKAAEMRERLQKIENPALAALEEGKANLHDAAEAAKNPQKKPKFSKDGLKPEERAEQNLAEAARQLQDQAELREQNATTNDQAALDTNRASRAAEKLARQVTEKGADLEKVRAETTELAAAARTLDADALAQNAVKALSDAAAPDSITAKKDPADAAAETRAAAEQLKELPTALRKANAPPELANAAQQASDTARGAADNLQEQAKQAAAQSPSEQRPEMNRQPTQEALQKAAAVAEQLAPAAESARQALAQLTPQVSEMMKQVAQDLKKTQRETQAAADQAAQNEPVEEVAKQAQELQPKAEGNAEKMASLQAALRQEANAAQLDQNAQRQMSRTADVALEQMRQKTPEIAQNLQQAAQAAQSQPQAQSLQKAADAQQQTAAALDQLAQNMAKTEKGEALSDQELAAAQKMEQDLAVKEPLDESYDRALDLAQMAKDAKENPAAVLAQLEKELPKNPAMQKALAEIGKATAQAAEKTLNEKADQPAAMGLAAEFAAHDLSRVARHEQRLGKQESADQIAKASEQLKQTAAETKTDPSKATPQMSQQVKASATQAAKSAEETAANSPAPATKTALEQSQGNILAQALDQLDQSLNPMQSQAPGQQQEGQQQQQSQQGQQSAQQSLSDAQKNQQQSMADQRNQGQVPGAQPPSQQMADNKNQPNQPSQQSKEGGNFDTVIKDGVLAGEMIMVKGDWGHLPSRTAKDLTEATRQEAAPEYRAAIESYYKAIATKSKQ